MAVSFPPVPAVLKPIQHYLKTAVEHEVRDPAVAYWSRIYALQAGLKIDRKSKESLTFLTALMDWLENRKKELQSNEAISNEVVAQAHIENYALKLFLWADAEDRAARFNKNVVKAFYTSGMLFDVLSTFGEMNDEVSRHRKYAKWKAAYIHNCLKNGETPIAGPVGGEGEGFEDGSEWTGESNTMGNQESEWKQDDEGVDPGIMPSGGGVATGMTPSGSYGFNVPSTSGNSSSQSNLFPPSAGAHAPPSTPSEPPATPTAKVPSSCAYDEYKPASHPGGVHLAPEDFTRAQKYCKWAGSALQYEDAPTAIDNLQKALKLLTTGQDSK